MSARVLSSSPHAHRRVDNGMIMQHVLLACLPGLTAMVFFFGWGTPLNIAWLCLLALVMEASVMKLRGRSPWLYLRDGSALVTAVLLALSLPPAAPWWLGLAGIFMAIVIAKHLYGGLGYNPFNPAMAAYAALLLAFPAEMTRWLLPEGVSDALPSFGESLQIFLGLDPNIGIDAFTGATALDSFRQQQGAQLFDEFSTGSPLIGTWSGAGWEWINIGFLFGGAYLVYKRIISWRIPFGVLGAIAVLALLFHDGGSSRSLGSPLFHLLGGATMLGAFFIATDPVTASTTPRGRLIYGALIGCLIYVIRAWSSYPEGVAFAVLLGNLAVPLIDLHTRPRTFGHGR